MSIEAAKVPPGFDGKASGEIERIIGQYCAEERHADLPAFSITSLLAWSDAAEDRWNLDPAARRPGCYVVYDSAGAAIYVGKASCNSFVGARLRLRQAKHVWPEASYVQIIEVAEPFEAPSLEGYILCKFQTSRNVNGVNLLRDR